jgi:AAA15 family ATPase/GTPase
MLLEFSIGNYRSFNDIQVLNFRATGLVSENKEVDQNNIVEEGDQRVLKTVGIYGSNGSGKSNILNGLRLFCNLVLRSLESESAMDAAANPFMLSEETPEHAGFFQIQLLLNQKKYRYGFTLSFKGTVLQEWLFGPAERNETWYFKRTGQDIKSNPDWFREGHDLPIETVRVRANTLFLTFVSAYNGPISQNIRSFIVKDITFDCSALLSKSHIGFRFATGSSSRYKQTNQLLKEGKTEMVLQWLKSAGLIYSNITLEQENNFEKVMLEKNVFNKEGTILGATQVELDEDESAGTRKFYSYIGILHKKFTEGGVLVSDKIDNNFHPFLLQQLICFFNNPAINTAGAQLLFTSHNTNLLQPDILRRDQIYFTEKSNKDETILYSLADLKGIRNNADFARQYLAGFYGALPMLEANSVHTRLEGKTIIVSEK